MSTVSTLRGGRAGRVGLAVAALALVLAGTAHGAATSTERASARTVVRVDRPGVLFGELATGAVGLAQGEVGLAGATDLLMAALLELPCLAESPGPSTSGHVKPPNVARPHRLPAGTQKSRSERGTSALEPVLALRYHLQLQT